jgi:hypothetical protein
VEARPEVQLADVQRAHHALHFGESGGQVLRRVAERPRVTAPAGCVAVEPTRSVGGHDVLSVDESAHVWSGSQRFYPRPTGVQPTYSDGKVANRNGRDFGWEIAHEAVSRFPPISLYTTVAHTEGYTYAAEVWALCLVQG